MDRVHRDGGYRRAAAVAVGGLGEVLRKAGGRRSTGRCAIDGHWSDDAAWPAPHRSAPPSRMSAFRGGRLRALGGRRLPTEVEWELRGERQPSPAISPNPDALHPAPAEGFGVAAAVRGCLGVDRAAHSSPTRVSAGRGRCRRIQRQVHVRAIRAARRLLRRRRSHMSAHHIAISFRPTPDGNLRACAWRRMSE